MRSTASARRCWTSDPMLALLNVDEVRAGLADGAVLIDARPVNRFAESHMAGPSPFRCGQCSPAGSAGSRRPIGH